jgi:hypothetical protein
MGHDLESPTSRFTMTPAVALGFPEQEWEALTSEIPMVERKARSVTH